MSRHSLPISCLIGAVTQPFFQQHSYLESGQSSVFPGGICAVVAFWNVISILQGCFFFFFPSSETSLSDLPAELNVGDSGDGFFHSSLAPICSAVFLSHRFRPGFIAFHSVLKYPIRFLIPLPETIYMRVNQGCQCDLFCCCVLYNCGH